MSPTSCQTAPPRVKSSIMRWIETNGKFTSAGWRVCTTNPDYDTAPLLIL
jgi:hypothetical protein